MSKELNERQDVSAEKIENNDAEKQSRVVVDIEDLREVTGGAPKYCDTIMCSY